MRYAVEVSVRAKGDMHAINRWLETKRSIAAADRWLRLFMKILAEIEQDPSRFPCADGISNLGLDLREAHFGKRPNVYRIYFEIQGRIVRIHRIRHAARDALTSEDL